MIKRINGKLRYYDKDGTEITDGCTIEYPDGKMKKVYRTTEDELGIDATNPAWIASGRAIPCEYGIYPLNERDTKVVKVLAE